MTGLGPFFYRRTPHVLMFVVVRRKSGLLLRYSWRVPRWGHTGNISSRPEQAYPQSDAHQQSIQKAPHSAHKTSLTGTEISGKFCQKGRRTPKTRGIQNRGDDLLAAPPAFTEKSYVKRYSGAQRSSFI